MKILLEIPDEMMHQILKKAEEEYVKSQESLNEFAAKCGVNPAPAHQKTSVELIQCAIEEYCDHGSR